MSTVHGGPGNIVTNGLVLNLDAANPRSFPPPYNGTVWRDLSGNNNSGSLVNGPTYSSVNGGSIVFDGVNDYCQIPNLNLTYPFTISFWGNQQDISTFGPHITISNPTVSNKLIGLGINLTSSNEIRIFYYDTTYTQSNSTGYVLNQTYNVTGIFTSSSFDLYINGIYAVSLSGAKSKVWTDTSTSYNVMRLNRVGEIVYKGVLNNTLIYNRALSSSEVLQNFNATRTRFGL